MVLLWRHLDDAVPQPNMLGARCRGRQEHFGADEWQYSSRKWCSVMKT